MNRISSKIIGLLKALTLILGATIVLNFQNCGHDKVNFNPDESSKTIGSEYTGNGDGYLGKPTEGNYKRTFASYSCVGDPLGTQGQVLVDANLVTLQKDSCEDITQNNTFEFTSPTLEFAPYNPDYIALGTGIYELVNPQSSEPPVTEAWCRSYTPYAGIDVVVKIDNNNSNTKAKIYLGTKEPSGSWGRQFVQPFTVSRVSESLQISYRSSNFELVIESPTQNSLSSAAVLTGSIDGRPINQAMSCRISYQAPVNLASPYQLAQFPDNQATTWINMSANSVLLHLNNITSGTFFSDSSGSGANANLWGNVTLNPNGKMGASINSDGQLNSYIVIPDSSAVQFGTGSFTLVTWYKLNSLAVFASDKVTCPLGKSAINSTSYVSGCIWSPAKWALALRDSNGNDAFVETAPDLAVINQWSHIALVVDRANNTAKIYYNGADATFTNSDISNISGNFNMAGSEMQLGGAFPINGAMDEIAIFKRALSPVEIQTIFNTQKIQF